MGIVVTSKERLRILERENRSLKNENSDLKALVEYIAICDYPEILEGEEEETND